MLERERRLVTHRNLTCTLRDPEHVAERSPAGISLKLKLLQAQHHPETTHVTDQGVALLQLETVRDRGTKEPADREMAKIVNRYAGVRTGSSGLLRQ